MGRIRVAIGVVVSLLVTGFVTVPAQQAFAAVPSWATVAATYAPQLRFHSQEQYWPARVSWLADHSRLRFSLGNGATDILVADSGTVDEARLGGSTGVPQYWVRVNGAVHYSNECLRPYEPYSARCPRPSGFLSNEGWYLAIWDTAHAGVVSTSTDPSVYSGTPIYYQHGALSGGESFITFWVSYAYDDFPVSGFPDQNHEGDWEHVSIRLDANRNPLTVAWAYHGCADIKLSWANVTKVSTTHPVAYVGQESHGMYPSLSVPNVCNVPGVLDVEDNVNNTGKRWNTWNSTADVANAGWFGFGGAWGEVDQSSIYGNTNATGPLGPSKYKDPTPWTEV